MAEATVKSAKIELLPPERETIDPFLEQLTDWMDTKFELPGLRWRFGMDALLGLVPGLGDAVTFFVSCYMLSAAARYGVPRIVIVRMGLNVAIDLVVGSIPILGDFLDIAWKANTRNLQLLRRTLEMPVSSRRRTTWTDWLIVIGGLAGLFAMLTIIVFITWTAISWLFRALSSV
jgi:hypothetical protein